MRLSLALALALTTALATPVFADDQSLITIEGHGEVSAAPDTAFITSGVMSQGATAREALDANTADMTLLIQTLKDAGIDARDIQTSGFSVSPNYVYTDARDENGYTLPPKIQGYQVTNQVSVRIRDITKLGNVLDRSVTVGSNTINGVTFSVADPSKLYDEARKAAFADAKSKAELYAGVAGVELEEIRSITEGPGYQAPPVPMAMTEMRYAAAKDVPVETGELTFAINVSVAWELGN